jgi:hypothetical protein
MKNTLIFRAKIYKMCHCGLFCRKNGTLISSLLWIRVQTFKIGQMVHHWWLPTKNPRSMPQVILYSHTSRISKRKLHVIQTDSIVSLISVLIPIQPFLDAMLAISRPIVELRHSLFTFPMSVGPDSQITRRLHYNTLPLKWKHLLTMVSPRQ